MEHTSIQQRTSRVLHWVGELTSRTATAITIVMLLIAFYVLLAVRHFPSAWQTAFATVVGSVTLVMLFVIQHTQSRLQAVLQMKLDELIRASPEADDALVRLEVADDAELLNRQQSHLAIHESVREGDGLEVVEFFKTDQP